MWRRSLSRLLASQIPWMSTGSIFYLEIKSRIKFSLLQRISNTVAQTFWAVYLVHPHFLSLMHTGLKTDPGLVQRSLNYMFQMYWKHSTSSFSAPGNISRQKSFYSTMFFFSAFQLSQNPNLSSFRCLSHTINGLFSYSWILNIFNTDLTFSLLDSTFL